MGVGWAGQGSYIINGSYPIVIASAGIVLCVPSLSLMPYRQLMLIFRHTL